MPTYDYLCRACGHELEIFQSMKESPKRKCPDCGALKLERQIGTGGGILFKGGGFYETDYRSESYKKAAEADKKGSESKPKKDAKPAKEAAKPEAKPEGDKAS
jgi:putative FmdB family regulatory protein